MRFFVVVFLLLSVSTPNGAMGWYVIVVLFLVELARLFSAQKELIMKPNQHSIEVRVDWVKFYEVHHPLICTAFITFFFVRTKYTFSIFY